MRQPEARALVLVLNGTVGTGKSTTAAAVGRLLRRSCVPHAVIDLDELRRVWPTPPDDPFASALAVQNLAVVVRNDVRAGAVRIVIAGVVEQRADRASIDQALGLPVTVCRLRVPPELVRGRLRQRHEDAGELAWHLERLDELHAVLENGRVDDVIVDVKDEGPDEVARMVLNAVGWIDLGDVSGR